MIKLPMPRKGSVVLMFFVFCLALFVFNAAVVQAKQTKTKRPALPENIAALIQAASDGKWDQYEPMIHLNFTVKGPRTRVSFILPPRRVSTLKVYPI